MSSHSRKQSRLAAEEILRFAQNDERGTRLIGVILTVLLAISMVPAVGLQSAFADEPVERPVTTGGDAALEGYAPESTPVAVQREDGMCVADGLVYTVADGGLSLVGFDGLSEGEDAPKEIVVPEAVSVDGKDTPVVAVDIAEGNVAESVVSLTLPQSINNVDTATLASALPNLASVEVAAPKASAPVAAGAAAMKAAYSSFGGILYKNARVASESDASQTTLTKELVWAPPATVVARIPAECTSIAPGAFADVKDLKTVVCFGVMESIPQAQKADDGTVTPGAFTDEQIQTVNVIVPQTGTVVPDGERVSADVAVTDDSTMDVKRGAWWQSGFASDRITLGEVYGSTTNTLPVTEEGTLEAAEAEVAYAPETTQNSSSRKAGIEPPESAVPTPVPDDDELDPSESGLVFTHLADMTLSVSWKGDPTATPAHIDIPAYATINGVAYPVTEIAPHAFEGAVFLTSVTIPEGITTIGDSAFAGCANLADATFPSTLRTASATAFDGTAVDMPATAQKTALSASTASDQPQQAFAPTDVESEVGDGAEVSTDAAGLAAFASSALSSAEGGETLLGNGESKVSDDDSITPYSSYPLGSSSFTLKFLTYSEFLKSMDTVYAFAPSWVTSSSGLSYSVSAAYAATVTITNGVTPSTVDFRYSDDGFLEIFINLNANGGYQGRLAGVVPAPYKVDHVYRTDSTEYSCYMSRRTMDASMITTGVLSGDRIPSLAASKISGLGNAATKNTGTGSGDVAAGNHTHADYLAGAVSNNVLTLRKQTTSGTQLGQVYTTGGTYSKTEVNGLLGSGISTSSTVASQLSAKAAAEVLAKDTTAEPAFTKDNTVRGAINDLDAATVKTSDFKLLKVEGVDEAQKGAYPTTYRKGKRPALPVPTEKGSVFKGWTTNHGVTAAKAVLDDSDFDYDDLTITAVFEKATPEGKCFFEAGALDYKSPTEGDGSWTSTIGVRLASAGSSVANVKFDAKDLTGLLTNASGVTFAVGSAAGSVSGGYKFGETIPSVALGDVDGGKGIWVKITIPAGGIDENRVVGSKSAEDYVASIATMAYSNIA